MEILQSKKIKLPIVYFISDREEIKKLPIGIPFVYGDKKIKQYFIRLLEYEVLYQAALRTGLSFNFKKILRDNGFKDISDKEWCKTTYFNHATDEIKDNDDEDVNFLNSIIEDDSMFKNFVEDSVAYVDIKKLKELNIFPTWLDDIEKAVSTNIHNFAAFNPYMYSKKLDGMYGGVEFNSPNRNLFVIDISKSIPKAIGTTLLTYGKTMAETFYADIIITGRKSVFIPYEELHTLDMTVAYDSWGNGQEQVMFKKIVSEKRRYNTAIVFGDNNHPGEKWDNASSYINDEDGKKICQFEVEKLISFHTEGTEYLAGYSRWFSPKVIEKKDNWVKYLKD